MSTKTNTANRGVWSVCMGGESMDETVRITDALDLHATVESNGVSIRMDGDRDAEMWVEGPEDGGEVYNGEVYRITLTGDENGVHSEVGFFVPVEALERTLHTDTEQ